MSIIDNLIFVLPNLSIFLLDKNIEKIQYVMVVVEKQIEELIEAISEYTDTEIEERIKDALITDLENMKKTLS